MEHRPIGEKNNTATVLEKLSAGKKISAPNQLLSFRIAVAIFFLAIILPSATNAENAEETERVDDIKAAFILNIARFVYWPKDTQIGPLKLCVYRSEQFLAAAESIQGKMASGREIEIRSVKKITENDLCNIVYVASDAVDSFASEIRPEDRRPMLTIADLTESDASERIPQIMISLVRNGARIGFEIDLKRVRDSGIDISSKLLKLAKITDGS